MTHERQPPFNDAAEREWALQEQAARADRLGLSPHGDAKLQSYRVVARALRQPLDEELPADFAAEVAAQVHRTADAQLELWLSVALLGLLGAMLLGVVVTYSQLWLAFARTLTMASGLSNPWLLALLAGLALPASLGKLSPRKSG
ncbi:hypothetical protein [Dyella mobilis]|uniref:Uncharacterized protein n=1 Tax=Dyella mobilis TaxID=1849582 RepID=A0ABS2KMQ8_9GAMM|nr:hypothetical protein [Dyella mobilis]MBM7132072.1 hypothetical protein [Dyella mobilis]GLQ95942.1 hypothetical protein GCM10007863_03600 [Dyella mobilis]